MNQLVDSFGRQHTYLRISVTERCNLRCVYCMPAQGVPLKPKAEMLTFEEIFRLARIFVDMGIDKIRITGGEPLVRKDVLSLIQLLGGLPLKTLAMTTNAVMLADKVDELRNAGINAVNISLDSLKREVFQELTLRDDFDNVMKSIHAAMDARFALLKLNVVVIAGKNDEELVDFVEFVKDTPLNVRFIEYMPFKDNQWQESGLFPYAEMMKRIEQRFELVPIPNAPGDVAKDYSIKGHTGTVSFITSMTESFCGTCNRLRLTADGSLKTCLFYRPEVSLRDEMRSGASDERLKEIILISLQQKPEAHPSVEELAHSENRSMVEIGG